MGRHFDWRGPNPHLAYLQRVHSRELEAIRHVDGRASVLTMTRAQDRRTTELLEAFHAKTGFGVLCQAPLCFPGRGFINRSSDLLRFVKQTGVNGFVIDGRMYLSHESAERVVRESAYD
jgi:hydroxymethyl cephem carbamoyltransferase